MKGKSKINKPATSNKALFAGIISILSFVTGIVTFETSQRLHPEQGADYGVAIFIFLAVALAIVSLSLGVRNKLLTLTLIGIIVITILPLIFVSVYGTIYLLNAKNF